MRIFLSIFTILSVYSFAEHAEAPQGLPRQQAAPFNPSAPIVPPPPGAPQPQVPQQPQAPQQRRYFMNPQQLSMSCWACAIRNMLAQYGVQKTEKEVVIMGHGRYINQGSPDPGTGHMGRILNKFGLKTGYSRRLDKATLASTLKKGHGVFAFVPGHVVIIQDVDKAGRFVMSDPSGGRTFKLTYSQLVSRGYFSTLIVKQPRTHQFQKGLLCRKRVVASLQQ
jgi:hypothetical protein